MSQTALISRHMNYFMTIDDFSFTQMVTEPKRYNNILDLFLTTNPTLVNQVACLPGLSDHDMVIAEGSDDRVRPKPNIQKPRKVQVLRKVYWPKLKSLLLEFQKQFVSIHLNKTKSNRKVQGVPQSQPTANPDTKRKRKTTKTNTYKTNKQTMHEKHTDQPPLPKAR